MARPTAALPGRARFGPADDADPATPMDDDEDVIGGLFGIEYKDSRGDVSARDIVVRAVAWKSERLQVAAHCLLRDAYRCFIAQNIVTLAHGRTGEIISDPVAFFGALAPAHSPAVRHVPKREKSEGAFAPPPRLSLPKMRKDLREAVRPAAVLLMAMAKADDVLTPHEVGVIADLVFEGARKTYTYQQTEMLAAMVQEMTALQPTPNMITRALNLTLDRGAFPVDLPQWLSRMARADGRIVAEENEAYRAILTTLRRLVDERDNA